MLMAGVRGSCIINHHSLFISQLRNCISHIHSGPALAADGPTACFSARAPGPRHGSSSSPRSRLCGPAQLAVASSAEPSSSRLPPFPFADGWGPHVISVFLLPCSSWTPNRSTTAALLAISGKSYPNTANRSYK
jgi:hypothetical protein